MVVATEINVLVKEYKSDFIYLSRAFVADFSHTRFQSWEDSTPYAVLSQSIPRYAPG